MAYEAGGSIQPGNLGVALTNGSADVARYNVFAVTVKCTFSDGFVVQSTFPYSRGTGTTCHGTIVRDTNNNADYWVYWQINLDGNTFKLPLVLGYNYLPDDGWNGTSRSSVIQVRGVV